MKTDAELWARIDAFALNNPDAELDFTSRLARENGWSRAFADRVVHDYRRFLYLTQVAGTTMTPSDAVDQAWHLHMTYTRHYWQTLCGEVLGRPLHHGPTTGGAAEDKRYLACYEDTLRHYEREFGQPPAADIWPEPAVRFGEAAGYRRVNTAHAWVIPRPRWLDRARAATATTVGAVFAVCGLSVAGATLALAQANDSIDEDTWIFIGFMVIFVVGITAKIIASGSRRPNKGRKNRGGSGCGSGCGGSGCSSGCGGGGCGGD